MSSRYLNAQIIRINSHLKTSGTHDNFYIPVNLKPDKEVDTVCCLSATVKKSFYLLQAGANTFTLVENGVTITITVPVANYGATSWKTVVAGLLNAATRNGWVYAITLPNDIISGATGKFTFTCVGGNPSFVFADY